MIAAAASDPELLIANLAMSGILAVLSLRLIAWVRDAPMTPDPWDAETDKKLSAPETAQACHHCSTPLSSTAWFCPHCGSAVGQYNNWMPYVQIFSEGEVLRNGLNARFRNRALVVTGYFLIIIPFVTIVLKVNSVLVLFLGLVLVLMYGVRLFKNLLVSKPPETN